jgi:hypothetical protein
MHDRPDEVVAVLRKGFRQRSAYCCPVWLQNTVVIERISERLGCRGS